VIGRCAKCGIMVRRAICSCKAYRVIIHHEDDVPDDDDLATVVHHRGAMQAAIAASRQHCRDGSSIAEHIARVFDEQQQLVGRFRLSVKLVCVYHAEAL